MTDTPLAWEHPGAASLVLLIGAGSEALRRTLLRLGPARQPRSVPARALYAGRAHPTFLPCSQLDTGRTQRVTFDLSRLRALGLLGDRLGGYVRALERGLAVLIDGAGLDARACECLRAARQWGVARALLVVGPRADEAALRARVEGCGFPPAAMDVVGGDLAASARCGCAGVNCARCAAWRTLAAALDALPPARDQPPLRLPGPLGLFGLEGGVYRVSRPGEAPVEVGAPLALHTLEESANGTARALDPGGLVLTSAARLDPARVLGVSAPGAARALPGVRLELLDPAATWPDEAEVSTLGRAWGVVQGRMAGRALRFAPPRGLLVTLQGPGAALALIQERHGQGQLLVARVTPP